MSRRLILSAVRSGKRPKSGKRHEIAIPDVCGYNAWCNERLYDAASRVSDADYRADRGAFFKSLHGTLNHLLVGDRIWMRRFTGAGELPPSLDAILFDGFDALRAARRSED